MNRLKNNMYIKQIKKVVKQTGFYFFCFNIKELYWRRLVEMDVVSATKKLYKKKMKRELDLAKPQLLNEKVQYLKLNDYLNNDLITRLADKYEVRQYIMDKGLGFLLNDIYGVYDTVEQLDWNALPEQ